jgi:hypothetical protein
MCAQLFVMDLNALGALRERRAKALVIEGPMTLYRIWDSKMDNRTRHWWFSEHLFNLTAAQSAIAKQSVRDWLRDRLALSFNFGACDRISKLTLAGRAALSAIEAWGLPMPQYSPITRDASGKTTGTADKDYWDKRGSTFRRFRVSGSKDAVFPAICSAGKDPRRELVMSPRRFGNSTTYKTRVAPKNLVRNVQEALLDS